MTLYDPVKRKYLSIYRPGGGISIEPPTEQEVKEHTRRELLKELARLDRRGVDEFTRPGFGPFEPKTVRRTEVLQALEDLDKSTPKKE